MQFNKEQVLEIVFGVATGCCIGTAFATNPIMGGIAIAGVVYRIFRNR